MPPADRPLLVFCLGTAAELIKCYPVIIEAHRRGMRWCVLSTGQSPNLLKMQFEDFGLQELDTGFYLPILKTRNDLNRASQALVWFAGLLSLSLFPRILKRIAGFPAEAWNKRAIWIVHGDTLSSLGGAILGRRLGLKLAHIEAGMRSGTWRSPFPEEISRRMVSRLTDLHFAPNPDAARALHEETAAGKVKGEIIEIAGNTQLDALATLRATGQLRSEESQPYAVANLHRFENLNQAPHWKILVDTVCAAASKIRVLFVMHPQTQAKIGQDPEIKRRLQEAGVVLLARQPFVKFAGLMSKAEFLLSDGGGNQDEARVLGLPTLILRTHTESRSGLEGGGPCLLSEMKQPQINQFLEDWNSVRRAPEELTYSPSKQVVDRLALDSS